MSLSWWGLLIADPAEDGGTEGLFSYGAGSRAIGLGGAGTAEPADYTAIYWNPAYLDFVPRMTAGFFHTSFVEGTPYDFASFTFPTLRMGTFSGGLFRISTGGITRYDEYGVPGGSFSFSQEEFLLGYGKKVIKGGSAGVLLKVDHQAMLTNNATGVGFDAAFSYNLGVDSPYLSSIRTGIVFRNLISPSLKLVSRSNTLPKSIVVGLGTTINLTHSHRITPLFDLEKMSYHFWQMKLGIEYNYLNYISFRGGFNQLARSFGFGLSLKNGVGFDYALRDADLLTQHLFSVKYSFGLSRDEKVAQEKRMEEERVAREVKENFQARKREEIKKHTQKAQDYLAGKDYFSALSEWQQVLAWDENNELARTTIEKISTILDDLQKERDLDAATRVASRELFDVGIKYYTEKRYPEAISSWERVLEIDPDHSLSKEYIERAREEVRNLVHAQTDRANRLIQAGDYTAALNDYHVALRYDPQNLAVLKGIKRAQDLIRSNESFREGLTYYLNNDYEGAEKALKRALELNPNNLMVKDYLSEIDARRQGKTGELRPELEKDYLKGVDLYLQGKYSEAIKIWEGVLREDPYNQRVTRNIEAANERLMTIKEIGSKK
jgi:tetratricopeptide (TPR) repeat protein